MEENKWQNQPLSWKKAAEWALVLDAMGIPYDITDAGDHRFLSVPDEFQHEAEEQIGLYEAEISGLEILEEKTSKDGTPFGAAVVFLLLYLFNLAAFFSSDTINWVAAGNASSEAILKGQVWRLVTSLTLHADMGHLLSNLVLLCVIGSAVSRYLGFGLGWLGVTFSGIAGNMLNAWVHEADHFSIGSSTAVFGALGILAGLQLFGKFRQKGIKYFIPIGGALALFAFLGMGDRMTDINAHLFGLLSGFLLGITGSVIYSNLKIPGFPVQMLLLVLNLGIFTASWAAAFIYR